MDTITTSMPPGRIITIGVDLGQRKDPTAIAVVEGRDRNDGEREFAARGLTSLPLGTSYPDVVARLRDTIDGLEPQLQGERPPIWLDATGLGTPVVDMCRSAGMQVTPCYFTHGDRLVENSTEWSWSVGKGLLVAKLQVILQTKRLLLPNTPTAKQLADELLSYEIRINPRANDTYGAFRVGAHDDLVTALGLAILAAARRGSIGVAMGGQALEDLQSDAWWLAPIPGIDDQLPPKTRPAEPSRWNPLTRR
jgi:hypothetical protein